MNRKVTSLIKTFSYTLTSNLISLLVSSLVVFVVPKLIGVEEYGYWQLYLFYSSYVGFLHFGWNDGIYLRYAGKDYESLDKKLFFSQFYMLLIFQLMLALVLYYVSGVFWSVEDEIFVLKMTAICMIIVNTRYMLLYIFQITNRIKEYAQVTIIDRITYCFLIILFLALGIREYKIMILADLLAKLIGLLLSMYSSRDIVFRNILTFYLSVSETAENIKVGIKLLFSNIASLLIIGIVRLGIENSWGVATFGKISLTLNVSNLIMLFVNAMGIIIFPMLKKTDENKLPELYMILRDTLMIVLLGSLILYYPINAILSGWLPEYAESLRYMTLIFPMCVFEGKMALLINTYLKTLRKEALMLKVNLLTIFLSSFLTYICLLYTSEAETVL